MGNRFEQWITRPKESFDPEGDGYDYETAESAGLKPDETGHWPSRDPSTGKLLKGRSHPTWSKTEEGERAAGYSIEKGEDGRYYSRQNTASPEEEQAAAQPTEDRPANKFSSLIFGARAVEAIGAKHGVPYQWMDAFWKRESSRAGSVAPRNVPDKDGNERFVRGPFQVMDSTFKAFMPGVDPETATSEQNAEAAAKYIAHLRKKYNNNPQAVAAAYLSGEGNVRPDGTIINDREDKVTGIKTSEYAKRLAADIGEIGVASGEEGSMREVEQWRRAPPLPPEQKEQLGQFWGSFWTNTKGMPPQAAAQTLEGLADYLDSPEDSGIRKLAARLAKMSEEEFAKFRPEVPQIKDLVDDFSLSRAWSYLQSGLGEGLASLGPILLMGGAGAGAGALLTGNPAGATIGGIIGASSASFPMNFGEARASALQSEDIKQALDEGRLTKKDITQAATVAGAVMTALDVVGAGALLGKIGPARDAKKALAKRVAQQVLFGFAAEGGTEGLQQTISIWAREYLGDQAPPMERVYEVADALVKGGLVGGAFGLAGGSRKSETAKEKEERERKEREKPSLVIEPEKKPPPPPPPAAPGVYESREEAIAAADRMNQSGDYALTTWVATPREEGGFSVKPFAKPSPGEPEIDTMAVWEGEGGGPGMPPPAAAMITPRQALAERAEKLRQQFGLPEVQEPAVPSAAEQATVQQEERQQRKEMEPKEPKPQIRSVVDKLAHEASSSPLNDLKEPSDKQIKAENYKKGHITIGKLDIAIKNPEGSQRSGVDESGRKWSRRMKVHYGYFEGTVAADSDRRKGGKKQGVAVMVRPGIEPSYSGPAFVIDQDKTDGRFDEHKVMLGWETEAEARKAYLSNYPRGWGTQIGAITRMTQEDLAAWLASPERTAAPLSTQVMSDVEFLGTVVPDAQVVLSEDIPARGRQAAGAVPSGRATKESARAAEKIAAVFGKRVVWFRAGKKAPDGFIMPGEERIFVNVESDASPAVVVGHELLHAMRADAKDLYDALHDAIYPFIEGREKDYYNPLGLNEDQLREEMIADLLAREMDSESFWRQVVKTIEKDHGKSFAQRVLEWIKDFLSELIANPQLTYQVEHFLNDAEQANAIISDLLAGYAGEYASLRKAEGKAGWRRGPKVGEPVRFSETGKEVVTSKHWYYSELERTVENFGLKSGKPEQWKGWLNNTPGLKKDEIEWTGVREWLDTQTGNVTKEQVVEYLKPNGVQIKEVVYGEGVKGKEEKKTTETATTDDIDITFGEWETEEPDDYYLEEIASERLEEELDELRNEAERVARSRLADEVERRRQERDRDAQLSLPGVEPAEIDEDEVLQELIDEESNDIDEDAVLARLVEQERDWYYESGDAPQRAAVSVTIGDDEYEFDVYNSYDGTRITTYNGREVYDGRGRDDAQIESIIREYVIDYYGIPLPEDVEELTEEQAEELQTPPEGLPLVETVLTGRPKFVTYQLDGAKSNYREFLLTLFRSGKEVVGQFIYSSHWGQVRNVVAFVRVNVRRDADGNLVLFLEEVQSDWAQQARREGGFGRPEKLPEGWTLKYSEDRTNALEDELGMWSVLDEEGDKVIDELHMKGKSKEQSREDAINAALNYLGEKAPPHAPFVKKTESWVALALKRMIRYAAEIGASRIAWTTGDEQNARWRLANVLDKISWIDIADDNLKRITLHTKQNGLVTLAVSKKTGKVREADWRLENQAVGKPLSAVLGEDAANKILNNAGNVGGAPAEWEISAEGLEVGAKGMREYYDRILPNVANDILKKLGGERVIKVPLVVDDKLTAGFEYSGPEMTREEFDNWRAENRDRLDYRQINETTAVLNAMVQHGFKAAMEREASPGLAIMLGGELVTKEPQASPHLGFEITPALRDRALLGMPKFSVGGKRVTVNRPAVERLVEYAKKNDSLFQFPRSPKVTMGEIAQEVYPLVMVTQLTPARLKTDPDRHWFPRWVGPRWPMPVRAWKIVHREAPFRKRAYVDEMSDGTVAMNIAGWDEGGGGSAVYATVFNYAAHNGVRFIEDPSGLSPASMIRRVENMLSSALKFGTTRHMAPGEALTTGRIPDSSQKWAPLPWKDRDDAYNIHAMMLVSMENIGNRVPESRDLWYNFVIDQYEDGNGKRIDADRFHGIVKSEGARAAKAGPSTLKRIALFNTLLRAESEGRTQLLGRSGAEPIQPREGLKRIAYSESGKKVAVREPGLARAKGYLQSVREVAPRIVRARGLPPEVDPIISSFRNAGKMRSHQDYIAAKKGDALAAQRLVVDLVDPAQVAEAERRFGNDAIYLPVIAVEQSGINAIPATLAAYYASGGAEVDVGVYQANKPKHTGASAMGRMIAPAIFDGEVKKGGKYVLVDDVITLGGTLAGLANYIQSNGGRVVGVVTMVNATRMKAVSAPDEMIKQVEEKYGDVVRQELGIEPAALTSVEARYVLTFGDVDALRGRAAQAARQRDRGVGAEGVQVKKSLAGKLLNAPPLPDWIASQPPEMQEALRRAGAWRKEVTLGERLANWKKNWRKRLTQGIFDQFYPLKEMGERIYRLARNTRGADAALEAHLMYGKAIMDSDGAIDIDYQRGGFLEVLKSLGGEHDRWAAWVVANRAERLLKEGREHNLTPEQIAQLKTLNHGQMADGHDRAKVYDEARKKLDEWNKAVVDIAERAGLIDPENRKWWEKDFYIPFYRLMEGEDMTTGPTKTAGIVNQYAFKALKGGPDVIGDPLHNILRNWAHLIDASLKNIAAKESLTTAVQMGVAVEAPEETARQIAKSIGAKQGVVSFLDQGSRRWFVVDEPFVLEAIKALTWNGFNGPAARTMQKFKRWLTLGVTISPWFRATNIMRDSISMIGTNPANYWIPSNLLKGWEGTKEGEEEFGRILAGGGVMRFGTLLEGDRAEHVKRLIYKGVPKHTILNDEAKIKAMFQKAWDWWQHTGDRAENINRVALYKHLRAQDVSHFDASFAARDVIDFGLQGTWGAVRMLVQTIPFFNARLQGLYKLGRGAAEDPRRFSAVMGAVALASVALLLAYKDDEEFKKREHWDRETFWWFKIGDTAYRIPKPFEIGALATLVERAVEVWLGDLTAKKYAERVGAIAQDQLSMNPIPQIAKPMIELWANKNFFTDRPIESEGMQRLSVANRESPETSAIAHLMGQAGWLSPVQVDHVIRGYFGWLGTMVVAAADLGARPLTDMPAKAEPRLDAYFGPFVRELPANQSKYVTELYDQAEKASQLMADIKLAFYAGQVEQARAMMKDTDKVRRAQVYIAAQRTLGEINGMIRRVSVANISAEEKRQRLDQLRLLRNRIAKQAVERAEAVQ